MWQVVWIPSLRMGVKDGCKGRDGRTIFDSMDSQTLRLGPEGSHEV